LAFCAAEAGDRADTESDVLWGFASLPQISQGPSSEGGAAARAVSPTPVQLQLRRKNENKNF